MRSPPPSPLAAPRAKLKRHLALGDAEVAGAEVEAEVLTRLCGLAETDQHLARIDEKTASFENALRVLDRELVVAGIAVARCSGGRPFSTPPA